MEVWTFTRKDNGDIIRFQSINCDEDLGTLYFFVDIEVSEYNAPWFSPFKEDLEYIMNKKSISPIESTSYRFPNTRAINLQDYEIVKYVLNR